MLRIAVCAGLRRTGCLGAGGARTCLTFLSVHGRAPCNLVAGGQVSVPEVKSVRFVSTSSVPVNHEEERLVYIGNLGKAVRVVKLFSYSTSMFTLIALPMVLAKSGIGVDSLPLKLAFYSMIGFFTFITPVTLHYVTKGYVVRLYYNKEKDLYTAVTYNAFLMEKWTEFSPADVEVPGMSKMFTTLYAKKKSMLINPMLFPNSRDYEHLMGYDKPFTFNPEDLNPPSKEK